ncbi:MAG: hypothetical protein US31_C0007G0022 [Berkelbacteria bacterium GW2011_GWA1_36_9]|uniref:Bacterial toxin RNase RnlA/LsoA DBD domain-containing protein n=1 Tax=Berkelbacteria bacterium GW2011_GWA1_36_9 TaxID=1618331 RepID=A0A0G0IQE2_9BACT|nr:MAG: hypothetical protein US31_C0007G0022 [Berkelbacteria bacterium GW2011_GWA1_36_9]
MSKYLQLNNLAKWQTKEIFGKARGNQQIDCIKANFDTVTLDYLSEKIINHLADSIRVECMDIEQSFRNQFNDFSFFTAPAYKAFEGFLFQIADDLRLPSSGNTKFVGTYFDEEKVDQTIDNLLLELEQKANITTKLDKSEKEYVKDMIKEMKRFLHHYRHTPAHFQGEMIDTPEKATQNIHSIYRIINETTKTLLKASLLEINEELH